MDEFSQEDANKYFSRNKNSDNNTDIILKELTISKDENFNIIEIGCCNGWRLNNLKSLYPNNSYYGLDLSSEAIKYGRENFTGIFLYDYPLLENKFDDSKFDIVLVPFVLMYISREKLLRNIAEIDRILKDGGKLVITDFSPNYPKKIKFKHNENLVTYKQNFYDIFISTFNYYLEKKLTFTHNTSIDDNKYYNLSFYVELRKDLNLIF